MPNHGNVVEVNPLTDPRWEALVSAHPDGLIYHHPSWLHTLALEQDQEPIGLAYEAENRELCGLLPLFSTRGLPFQRSAARTGQRLSSLPRTPLAGPLAYDPGVTRALIDAAIERVRAIPGSRLEIKTESPDLAQLAGNLTTVSWRPNYVLDLPKDPGHLRFGDARNHSRVRWAVNHARKAGVKIREAENHADLRVWYRLYLETMRTHCLPPRSFRFFRNLWDVMHPRNLMRLVLAEQYEGGQPRILAGSILLRYGNTVFYAFNGRRRQDLSLHPNDLIQWHAIHDACEDRFQRYDFGEVPMGNEGLDQFKRKWGAATTQLYRYYYPAPRDAVDGSIEPDSLVRRLASRCWQLLPLPVTGAVGGLIYGYL